MKIGFWPPVYGNWIMSDDPALCDPSITHTRDATQLATSRDQRRTDAGLVGTPNLIAERVHKMAALGVETFLLQFHPMLEEIERFRKEIMPLVRS